MKKKSINEKGKKKRKMILKIKWREWGRKEMKEREVIKGNVRSSKMREKKMKE